MKISEINNLISEKIDSYFTGQYLFNNICINGEWGSGKTTLIQKMKEKSKYDFVILNMWKYEIFSDNFSCIFFLDLLDNFQLKLKITNKSLKIVKSLIKLVLSKTLKIDIEDIKKTFNDESSKMKKVYENFIENKDLIFLFKEIFSNIDKKIIVVFDELDRCCDTLVIKLLSSIKNILFEINSSNIFYIVPLNKNHINEILGNKKEQYTEKIFDLNINLNDFIEFDESIINTENSFIIEYINNIGYKNFRVINKVLNQVKINYVYKNNFIEFLWFWKVLIEEIEPNFFINIYENVVSFNSDKITTMLKETEKIIFSKNPNFSLAVFENFIRKKELILLDFDFKKNSFGSNPVNIAYIYKNIYIPVTVLYPFIKNFENFIIRPDKIRVNHLVGTSVFGDQINIYIDINENKNNFYYEEIEEILNLVKNEDDIYYLKNIFNDWKKIIIK